MTFSSSTTAFIRGVELTDPGIDSYHEAPVLLRVETRLNTAVDINIEHSATAHKPTFSATTAGVRKAAKSTALRIGLVKNSKERASPL